MKRISLYLRDNIKIVCLGVALLLMAAVMLSYRLGSLEGGMSGGELHVFMTKYNISSFYSQPLYWPLDLLRYASFGLIGHHGQFLTRLPDVMFGYFAVVSFFLLIYLWHGLRTAVLTTALFLTASWTLHISRIASYDVLYLCTVPILLLATAAVTKWPKRAVIYYLNIILLGALLYLPGAVWLVGISLYFQRSALLAGWRHFSTWWQRAIYVILGVISLPLLVTSFIRDHRLLLLWLGLPQHLSGPLTIIKNLVNTLVYLFYKGPFSPQLWLDRSPILDVFTLIVCLIGIYFYATHFRAVRSRLLGLMFLAALIIVSLGGPVGLSLLVPLLYVSAAAGTAFLLREWLVVFPLNPLARGLGIGLVVTAIIFASVYNLRAYFVAWPNSPVTKTVFIYHRT